MPDDKVSRFMYEHLPESNFCAKSLLLKLYASQSGLYHTAFTDSESRNRGADVIDGIVRQRCINTIST